jgi:hypothetical protein
VNDAEKENDDMTIELDDLKQRNEELEVRIAMLENRLNPKPLPPSNRGPVDYTEGFSMPRSAMQAMTDAVPESVMRSVMNDALKPNPVTQGATPPPTKQRATPNFAENRPLEAPPGIDHVDRLVSHQDRLDRAERAYALAKAAALTPKGK